MSSKITLFNRRTFLKKLLKAGILAGITSAFYFGSKGISEYMGNPNKIKRREIEKECLEYNQLIDNMRKEGKIYRNLEIYYKYIPSENNPAGYLELEKLGDYSKYTFKIEFTSNGESEKSLNKSYEAARKKSLTMCLEKIAAKFEGTGYNERNLIVLIDEKTTFSDSKVEKRITKDCARCEKSCKKYDDFFIANSNTKLKYIFLGENSEKVVKEYI